jgi:hypothetical protein
MPRILTPTFSGTGCPAGGKIRYNYMGKWKCSHSYDVQLLIPDLEVLAEPGTNAKADCTITFFVDKLEPGWQVSLWDGVLDVDAEIGRGSELKMRGSAKWEGLDKGVSSKVPYLEYHDLSSLVVTDMKQWKTDSRRFELWLQPNQHPRR